jgi:hypothetical protein
MAWRGVESSPCLLLVSLQPEAHSSMALVRRRTAAAGGLPVPVLAFLAVGLTVTIAAHGPLPQQQPLTPTFSTTGVDCVVLVGPAVVPARPDGGRDLTLRITWPGEVPLGAQLQVDTWNLVSSPSFQVRLQKVLSAGQREATYYLSFGQTASHFWEVSDSEPAAG